MKKYQIEKKIGEGGQAKIYLAKKENQEERVALKMIHVEDIDLTNKFLSEIQFIQKIKSQYICQYTEAFLHVDDDQNMYFCIIMPFYLEGDLQKFLLRTFPLDLKLIKGVKDLHENKIIHRDLKPENILVEKKECSYELKITDLDLAKDMSKSFQNMTKCGTNAFLSPEVAGESDHSFESDIFSVGCIFYYLLTCKNRVIYTELLESEQKCEQMVYNDIVKNYPEELGHFVNKFLRKKPSKRIQLKSALTYLQYIEEKLKNKDTTKQNQLILKEVKVKPNSEDISKKLCGILRHSAKRQKIFMKPDGYVKISDILALEIFKDISLISIKRIVNSSEKKRFKIQEENGELWIKALYGHSINLDLPLTELKSEEIDFVIHPIYEDSWAKARKGLQKDERRYIHFRLSEDDVDIRYQVMIYIDIKKAMKDGIKFYKMENGSVVSEGLNGFISSDYFVKVCDAMHGEILFEKAKD